MAELGGHVVFPAISNNTNTVHLTYAVPVVVRHKESAANTQADIERRFWLGQAYFVRNL